MHIYRPLKGVAVFEAKRDRVVAFIDLFVIGAKVARSVDISGYERQFEDLRNTLKALGVISPSLVREVRMALKYKRRLLLSCLFVSNNMVRYVAVAAFTAGVLAELSRRLEASGWRRLAIVEMKPSKRVEHS